MIIDGISADVHLIMFYGYCIMNSPIPIIFIINIVGPVSIDVNSWYKISKYYELRKIEFNDIIVVLKIIKLFKFLIINYLFKILWICLLREYIDKELTNMIKDKKF